MWYFPAGSAFTVYSPDPPVWTVIVRPVPVLVTSTVAFATTAPLASVMVPTRRAVSVWASATPARHRRRLRAIKNLRFMFPPISGHRRGYRETLLGADHSHTYTP